MSTKNKATTTAALSPKKLNLFLFFKLPSAFITGVRVSHITEDVCKVRVRHRWINQNPFRSLYFAVQAMAAELSTGALVLGHIQATGKSVSMLVARNESTFTKKATGKIVFTCKNGNLAKQYIEEALSTGQGQTFWMQSTGVDAKGDTVSVFKFEWTLKVKS